MMKTTQLIFNSFCLSTKLVYPAKIFSKIVKITLGALFRGQYLRSGMTWTPQNFRNSKPSYGLMPQII